MPGWWKRLEAKARELRPNQSMTVRFPEASKSDLGIMRDVKPYTMTSDERLWALISAVRYVEARGVPGDIVECGVWRGGSVMAAAKTLSVLGNHSRTIWLFDTFEGMSKPTAEDVSLKNGRPADERWEAARTTDDRAAWCDASLEDVRANLGRSEYPMDRFRFVKGKVEDTLRDTTRLPERIALLRLDTDWYLSTKAEMDVLYPRLAPGGVLILDDYGHWAGSKQAVDEYLAEHGISLLLNRVDRAGRIAVKA